ncbi:MAG: hypothetical protein GY756_09850 [bacterium]|nr:hypothetical protein [bacterium]
MMKLQTKTGLEKNIEIIQENGDTRLKINNSFYNCYQHVEIYEGDPYLKITKKDAKEFLGLDVPDKYIRIRIAGKSYNEILSLDWKYREKYEKNKISEKTRNELEQKHRKDTSLLATIEGSTLEVSRKKDSDGNIIIEYVNEGGRFFTKTIKGGMDKDDEIF